MAQAICNKDCFNCTYEDCVLDTLDAEDYALARKIEAEVILPKSKEQERSAAKQRAYREANRDEIAAKQRAYYEANRDEIAAKQRAYREANRDAYNAYMREYLRKRRSGQDAENKA